MGNLYFDNISNVFILSTANNGVNGSTVVTYAKFASLLRMKVMCPPSLVYTI